MSDNCRLKEEEESKGDQKCNHKSAEFALKEKLSIKRINKQEGMVFANCKEVEATTALTIYRPKENFEEKLCAKVLQMNMNENKSKEVICTREENEAEILSTGTSDSSKEKKGRFIIENVSKEITRKQSVLKKGRFNITENLENNNSSDETKENLDVKKLLKIIEMQSKQLDLLFDMIKNFSKEDKLFHKDFINLSNDTYEFIERFKKKMKKNIKYQ